MKLPTIFSLVLFLICMMVNGQEYVHFPLTDAKWHIYLETTCDNDSPPDTFLLRYYFDGDTVIDDVTYSHLFCESGDTIHTSRLSSGGIREENKRVYYIGDDFLRSSSEGEEILLYDFNMQVNDTVYHTDDGRLKSIVLAIDSVQIGDRYRKRYLVDNGWYFHNPDYIIEGIGSVVHGLFGHITTLPTCGYHFWEHVCFFSEDQLIYKNPTFTDCSAGKNLSTVENMITSQITIYPNPFNESIVLGSSTYQKSMSLQVFNALGRLILNNSKVVSNEQIEIFGPAGIYIAIVKDEKGKILLKKELIKTGKVLKH
jgi:hypothetical protein